MMGRDQNRIKKRDAGDQIGNGTPDIARAPPQQQPQRRRGPKHEGGKEKQALRFAKGDRPRRPRSERP